MSIAVTFEAGTGFSPRIVRIVTTSTLAQVQAAGWYSNAAPNQLQPSDQVEIAYAQGSSSAATAIFSVSIIAGVVTLSLSESSVVLPTVAGTLAVFTNTTGTIADNQANATNTTSVTSATPGTVRSIIGVMSESATTMSSGSIVGVRGAVNYVGASGGFIYGVQGKIIPTGTLSGSSWNAGVFGQLDISAATVNAGQMAPIWGDYGSTSHTLTDQTGLYGIAMTNTTAAVLAGQLYLYGGATNLMLLNTNAGLSGTTYFKAAGTSSGSAGYASGCNATEVLTISVNGTTYYLPCFAQNS